jgi:DNA-binding NtrC family response regulator
VLKLPPLRQRGRDIKLLINRLLVKVNEESQDEPGYKDKKLSLKGEKLMLQHSWLGNVRELLNTLRRLAVWSAAAVISEKDVSEGLLKKVKTEFRNSNILELDISKGIDLNKVLYEIEQDLIEKAWVYSGQRKQKTADLLGLKNYQTLTPRLKKYGLE